MNVEREKAIVQELLAMCQEIGIDADVIDSKAVFSQNLGRYTQSKAAPVGFPDIVGNSSDGRAVFIEAKAKGKLHTLRPEQKKFLLRKLDAGCFAVCVDSADSLFGLFVRFRQDGPEFLKAVLEKIGTRS